VLRDALKRCDDRCLTPRAPRFAIDSRYILAAAGVLAEVDAPAAQALMRESLWVRTPSVPQRGSP
jgi:hypothetical protein